MTKFDLLVDGTKSEEELAEEYREKFIDAYTKEVDSSVRKIISDIAEKQEREKTIRRCVEDGIRKSDSSRIR